MCISSVGGGLRKKIGLYSVFLFFVFIVSISVFYFYLVVLFCCFLFSCICMLYLFYCCFLFSVLLYLFCFVVLLLLHTKNKKYRFCSCCFLMFLLNLDTFSCFS